MRFWTDKCRSFCRLAGAVKNTRYAICLREQRSIYDSKPEPDTESLYCAGQRFRFGKKYEGHDVTDETSGKQHEAELTTGSFDDRGVAVTYEGEYDNHGEHDAEAGQRHGHERVHAHPLHVLLLKPEAAVHLGQRPPSLPTVRASELVLDVLKRLTLGADPTADVPLLHVFDLARPARLAAL